MAEKVKVNGRKIRVGSFMLCDGRKKARNNGKKRAISILHEKKKEQVFYLFYKKIGNY